MKQETQLQNQVSGDHLVTSYSGADSQSINLAALQNQTVSADCEKNKLKLLVAATSLNAKAKDSGAAMRRLNSMIKKQGFDLSHQGTFYELSNDKSLDSGSSAIAAKLQKSGMRTPLTDIENGALPVN